jgi:Dyp-type peroxidase family
MSGSTAGTASVTVFARIADGRAADVRERLRAYREQSPFAGLSGVHFARLVVLEHAVRQERPTSWTLKARLLDLLAHAGRPARPDDLPHPYLMMTATVDGEPADFFRRLQTLGPDADAIWGDCTGYPGHHRQDDFVTFFTRRSVRADYTFSGSPAGSVAEITDALRLRRKVAAFAATAPDAGGNLRGRFRTAVDLEDTVPDESGPAAELDLPDIQGLVLRGFGDHCVAAHLFLQITSGPRARRWLRTVAPAITSAAEVRDRPARALHLGISHAGLTRLEVPAAELAEFPAEFREGMHAREEMLSPGRGTKPWQEPFDAPGAVDIVLLLSATGSDELDPWLKQVRAELTESGGLRIMGEEHGARMSEPAGDGRTFVEHFGFADGISQPRVAGYGRSTPGEVLPPGEFVLGLKDVDGDIAGRRLPPELRRNGSYLVYRKLEQDVPAFREMTGAAAGGFAGGADDVAAGLVGRRRDGELLAPCPVGAHVRRANPRGTLPGGSKLTRRHLMLRRGIPYGRYLPPGADDDGAERGLLFLAVVGDPGRQFEFVQTEWLADGNVFGRGREEDIFTTAGGPGARILLGAEPPAYVAVPRPLVTCRGGEYFLLPGLTTLRALAGAD